MYRYEQHLRTFHLAFRCKARGRHKEAEAVAAMTSLGVC